MQRKLNRSSVPFEGATEASVELARSGSLPLAIARVRQSALSRASWLPQPARFILAGGIAASVNWLSRFAFSEVMPFTPAVIAAAIIGMTIGFLTYRAFVFPGSVRHVHHQLRDFLLVNASTMIVVAIVATLMRSVLAPHMQLKIAEATAHALGIGAGAILNYHGHRLVTFHRDRGRAG